MLTERQGIRLRQWPDAVRQDDLSGLRAHKIKMLKRQMFGRAGFDLLRERDLLSS